MTTAKRGPTLLSDLQNIISLINTKDHYSYKNKKIIINIEWSLNDLFQKSK